MIKKRFDYFKIYKYPSLFHKYLLGISTPNKPITYELIQNTPDDKTFNDNKLFAHLHCYDISKFNEIYSEYIEKICSFFKVVITYSIGENNINDKRFVIIKIPNKGMDIGAKFCMVQYLNDNKISYEYIFFLHSKSNIETRCKYFIPLIGNLNEGFIDNINTYDGYFPDIQWQINGNKLKMISGNPKFANSNLPERNLENKNDLLGYLGYENRTNRFVEGNVYILSKKIVDILFVDKKLYNILNVPNDFDYNWVRKRYGLSGGVNNVYNDFKTKNLSARDKLSYDGYIEHAFERVVLNLCSDYSIKTELQMWLMQNQLRDKLKTPIKIDLAVPMYYGTSKSKKKLSIVFLKYLRYISDTLVEYKIHLSFTIVGSDKQDSLNLFNTYLKKNQLDTYFEFDQSYISYQTLSENYRGYNNPIFMMLHHKFYYCFEHSWKKDVNIYCISGSNDFIDMNFYINAAYKYDGNKSQIYGLNKRKNVSLITSGSTIKKLNLDNIFFWDLDYGDNKNFKDVCFAGGIIGISSSSFWEKPKNKKYILDCIFKSMSAYNEVEIEKIFIKNGDCTIETIRGCFSINYKNGEDLTSLQMVKDTIISNKFFDITSKNIIFTKCNKFWNKILSL